MKKTRRVYKPRKRFTIIFMPNSSARIKRINVPYWAFYLLTIPFICIIAIVIIYQAEIIDRDRNIDDYKGQIMDSSQLVDKAVDEKSKLEQSLSHTESLLEESRQQTLDVRSQLDSFDSKLAELYAKIDAIDEVKRGILDVFEELQALNIPISFDESALVGSDEGSVAGAYTDDTMEILSQLDDLLSNEMLDMRELEAFAEMLSAYFSARPIGSPLPGRTVGSGYGYRRSPINGETEFHEAVDIPARVGEEIFATADGTVAYSDFNTGGYGNLVIIEHGYGYSTYYAHNSENVVRAGEEVTRGQLIALAGNTGETTTVHCHYEVRLNGATQDPGLYMQS